MYDGSVLSMAYRKRIVHIEVTEGGEGFCERLVIRFFSLKEAEVFKKNDGIRFRSVDSAAKRGKIRIVKELYAVPEIFAQEWERNAQACVASTRKIIFWPAAVGQDDDFCPASREIGE